MKLINIIIIIMIVMCNDNLFLKAGYIFWGEGGGWGTDPCSSKDISNRGRAYGTYLPPWVLLEDIYLCPKPLFHKVPIYRSRVKIVHMFHYA